MKKVLLYVLLAAVACGVAYSYDAWVKPYINRGVKESVPGLVYVQETAPGLTVVDNHYTKRQDELPGTFWRLDGTDIYWFDSSNGVHRYDIQTGQVDAPMGLDDGLKYVYNDVETVRATTPLGIVSSSVPGSKPEGVLGRELPAPWDKPANFFGAWWRLDLDKPLKDFVVEVTESEGNSPLSVVETSLDGVSWTVATKSKNTIPVPGGHVFRTQTIESAKYVRIRLDGYAEGQWYEYRLFQVRFLPGS